MCPKNQFASHLISASAANDLLSGVMFFCRRFPAHAFKLASNDYNYTPGQAKSLSIRQVLPVDDSGEHAGFFVGVIDDDLKSVPELYTLKKHPG